MVNFNKFFWPHVDVWLPRKNTQNFWCFFACGLLFEFNRQNFDHFQNLLLQKGHFQPLTMPRPPLFCALLQTINKTFPIPHPLFLWQELPDVPFYYVIDDLSKTMRCSAPSSKVIRWSVLLVLLLQTSQLSRLWAICHCNNQKLLLLAYQSEITP